MKKNIISCEISKLIRITIIPNYDAGHRMKLSIIREYEQASTRHLLVIVIAFY